jgi:hypothetical protein
MTGFLQEAHIVSERTLGRRSRRIKSDQAKPYKLNLQDRQDEQDEDQNPSFKG